MSIWIQILRARTKEDFSSNDWDTLHKIAEEICSFKLKKEESTADKVRRFLKLLGFSSFADTL